MEQQSGEKRKFDEFEQDKMEQFISMFNSLSEDEFVNYLTNEAKENVVVTDEGSKIGYVWIKSAKLWKRSNMVEMANGLRNCWYSFIDDCFEILYDKLEMKQSDQVETCLLNKKIERLQNFQDKIGDETEMTKLFKKVSLNLYNQDFMSKLNRKLKFLPIQNKQVINLETLLVRPRYKQDMFTYECPVEFIPRENDETYKVAETYLKSFFDGNEYFAKCLQKLIGYCFTGETSDQSFYILHGSGNNGKSVLSDILERMLGYNKFHVVCDDNIIQKTQTNPNIMPVYQGLIDARLTVHEDVNEINMKQINKLVTCEEIAKKLTLTQVFRFSPISKHILFVNMKPTIIRTNENLNMLKYLEFTARFENTNSNNQYIQQLKTTHLNVLFSYLAHGSSEWYLDRQLNLFPLCQN